MQCFDSLFLLSSVWPCVQTSASSSSRSAPKKMPTSARGEVNAAASEILTKVRSILILITLDMGAGGTLRFVFALFSRGENIKAPTTFTMSQRLIYFRNSGVPTANKTGLDDETQTCADDQHAAARTYYCHGHH